MTEPSQAPSDDDADDEYASRTDAPDADTDSESLTPESDGSTRARLAERRGIPSVYGPAEDSVLLAETVLDDLTAADRLLDVGTGSGYLAARARAAGATAVGTDLALPACRTARSAGVPVVRTDLVAGVCGSFDVVTFNPPYLPTPPELEWDDSLEHALSGGPDGRRLIDPFLDAVGRVLAPGGRVYLLVSTLTEPDAVRERARTNGLIGSVRAEAAYPYERLLVLVFGVDGTDDR